MINTQYPIYFLFLCVGLGVLYAIIAYFKIQSPWSSLWNKVLFISRVVLVAVVAFLFLEPYFIRISEETQPKKVVFIWDNSKSVSEAYSETELAKLKEDMAAASTLIEDQSNAVVEWVDLDLNPLGSDSLSNSLGESPLANTLQELDKAFEPGTLAEVVLISDGIFNNGLSPEYTSLPYTLNTLAIGDSSKQKDISIESLRYNKISYQGNDFPLEVELYQYGFKGEQLRVQLLQDGSIVRDKKIRIGSVQSSQTIRFILEATEAGLAKYEIKVESRQVEKNTTNNKKVAYINVIEGKKDVLLLAAAPHPDIKAFRKSLEANDNYSLDVVIEGIHELDASKKYELMVLYQLPNVKNSFRAYIDTKIDEKLPAWFIVGENTDVRSLNALNKSMKIQPFNDFDEAQIWFDNNFSFFDLNNEHKSFIANLPPALVPYTRPQTATESEILMRKKIGSVQTEVPVFAMYSNSEIRHATLLLTGFWRWSLLEYSEFESNDFFEEWISKSVRYLTALSDQKQFKFYPEKQLFSNNESVIFNAELYNQIFERIYNIPIQIEISSDSIQVKRYEFTPDRLKSSFALSNLEPGNYTFKATTSIEGKNYTEQGEFTVYGDAIELQQLEADFPLLYRLAQKNGGNFYRPNTIDSLKSRLLQKEYPYTLKSNQTKDPLESNTFITLLIFILLFSEWFLRRYHGSY